MEADALDSWDILRSATIEGARAIGMADRIGSLEPGKQADIIAIRGDNAHLTPFIASGKFFNLHHNIVHAAQGSDVVLTMVDGRVVAERGILLGGDMPRYIADVERVAAGVIDRRAAWLNENERGAFSPV